MPLPEGNTVYGDGEPEGSGVYGDNGYAAGAMPPVLTRGELGGEGEGEELPTDAERGREGR